MINIRHIFIAFFLITGTVGNAQVSNQQIKERVDKLYPELESLYKHFHTNPELSFHEIETAARMAEELRKLGFKVTEKVGGHGIVAIMGNGKGPTVLIRADMDALPIEEATGLPYASKVKTKDDVGKEVCVMHACGHDVHMTSLIGTAKTLAALKDKWKGTLVLIGQPAEERSGGAKAMLADGLYKKFPVPDYALALHVSAALPAGTVGYTPGYALANVDMVDITVKGEGGHGAYPHTTKDPVVLAAQIIMALQTVVSRETSPIEPAVLTVGSIHGGTKGNVIPNEVKMELTLRSYSDEVRNAMLEKIKRITSGLAMAAGLPEEKYPEIYVRDEYTPALYNDPALSQRLEKIFTTALGKDQVRKLDPVMGGEDFGRYGRAEVGPNGEKVPILLFWLGAVDPEKVKSAEKGEIQLPSLHSAQFAPVPEPTIKTGVIAMSAAAIDLFNKK